MNRRAAGFSLVELLVVVGLIAILSGTLALALRDTGGPSLATAQTTLAAVVGTARAQAAVQQTRARIYVYGTRPPGGDADKFLRLLQVFREEPADSNNFVPVGSAVSLPRGVFIVPPTTAGLLGAGVVWPSNPAPVSTFAVSAAQALRPPQPTGTPFGAPATGFHIEFAADGTPTPTNAKLVVATAALTNNVPQFNNPGALRGVVLRANGAITLVNDPAGF